jgi:hypothetical protein
VVPGSRPRGFAERSAWTSAEALRRRALLDLGDFAVAVARQPIPVAGQLGLELPDFFPAMGLAQRVLVEDLALGIGRTNGWGRQFSDARREAPFLADAGWRRSSPPS